MNNLPAISPGCEQAFEVENNNVNGGSGESLNEESITTSTNIKLKEKLNNNTKEEDSQSESTTSSTSHVNISNSKNLKNEKDYQNNTNFVPPLYLLVILISAIIGFSTKYTLNSIANVENIKNGYFLY